jgi:hypothetical protein
MNKWLSSLGVIALLATGCVNNLRDTTLYHSTGRQKAIVAVLPVISHVDPKSVDWDLSREFTDEIRKRVYESTKIYLLRDASSPEISEAFTAIDPTTLPSSLVARLQPAQFAIVAELLDQQQTPYGQTAFRAKAEESGALLETKMRVRVIDLRFGEPKVIFQDLLEQQYDISRAYLNCNWEKMGWGTEAFQRTPMGLVHSRLVRELVARVESYIEAAR